MEKFLLMENVRFLNAKKGLPGMSRNRDAYLFAKELHNTIKKVSLVCAQLKVPSMMAMPAKLAIYLNIGIMICSNALNVLKMKSLTQLKENALLAHKTSK